MNINLSLVESNARLDERLFLTQREYTIKHENSLFVLESDKTFIILNYSISLCVPYIDKPQSGIVRISVFNHIKERGAFEKKISSTLKKILIKSRCIDQESLCLIFNELCYSIDFSIQILESNGNLFRFCTELLLYSIEKIDIINELSSKYSDLMAKHILADSEIFHNRKILVNYQPKCFYFIQIKDKILVDPTAAEDNLKDAWFLVVMDNKNMLYLEKSGGECNIADIMSVITYCTTKS
ncbi:hypothetical protein EDEG_02177 [Edhazardia aedis USNM 41457]|uniref:Uncharacterized protein n=1 Tax=Edhazardia aedis (strain USNM 41457) TaxID=1003232 RepID=J9D6S6_EDHAE|nr:hypothetical protein EDEG_02177 [Edhazardia aedis USNM 41457]|eukprot:EJW03481.1 hypothetical protein EDEG_02177 [Edhazardia aedis USNM 41457]